MEAIIEKLKQLLDEFFVQEGFGDCFLVDLIISKSGRVQVFVDCESGVTLEKCSKISRYLEAYLDESLVLGEKYTLDVSSSGIGRPLIKRQYPINIGRKIKVKTLDGSRIKGELLEVDEDGIEVMAELPKKEQKRYRIAFKDIEESKIIVSF